MRGHGVEPLGEMGFFSNYPRKAKDSSPLMIIIATIYECHFPYSEWEYTSQVSEMCCKLHATFSEKLSLKEIG